jgi:hypothetical protein
MGMGVGVDMCDVYGCRRETEGVAVVTIIKMLYCYVYTLNLCADCWIVPTAAVCLDSRTL